MTAEKHPLETVREALDVATVTINTGGRITRDTEVYKIMKAALTTLTLYMGQTQSCAECERLARENARYREAVRGLADRIKTIRQCERPLMCADLEAGNDYILDAFSYTIADAGGE